MIILIAQYDFLIRTAAFDVETAFRGVDLWNE